MNLTKDILRIVKHIAQQCDQSLKRMLSALILRVCGQQAKSNAERERIPVLPRRPGARSVTPQHVKELLEQE